jgi:hypothetical protein
MTFLGNIKDAIGMLGGLLPMRRAAKHYARAVTLYDKSKREEAFAATEDALDQHVSL